ncbi:MAG: glycosyltransferase [Solirubrobacterales bacterium]|nr:glycosyltransferase [Solirubrobacterales bacterium]
MKLAKAVFWGSVAGLVHTHVTYPLSLAALRRVRGVRPSPQHHPPDEPPFVSLIIPAFDEEDVIADKLANALALDYPRERLELIVASDGSSDRTAERAREAGADVILELPRGGKMATQNAAVERARGEIIAFSDANSTWEQGALAELAAAFEDPAVGYAGGEVSFTDPVGDNEEGAYWRLENLVRGLESELGGITAGNGAIYAVRRSAYRFLEPSRSHDLSFPFLLRKDGWRSVHVAAARADEKMVPTIEGEFARKRRMMVGLPDIVVADRMWDPRGYGPLFAFQILSHRLLRYASPMLHVTALLANLRLLGAGWVYRLALGVQAAVFGGAALADRVDSRVARLARYYVLVTASIALGFWDRWRGGPPGAWERSAGTR